MKKISLIILSGLLFLQSFGQISNPGFEWRDLDGRPSYWAPAVTFVITIDTSCGWNGLDSISFNTTDAHTGKFAFEMRVATYCGNAFSGSIKPTQYKFDTSVFDQSIILDSLPSAIGFFYKFFPVSGDRGMATAVIKNSVGTTIADGTLKLPAERKDWTAIAIPLKYKHIDTPAFMTLKFYMESDSALHKGSRFLIDDISLTGPTIIREHSITDHFLNCFPVPAFHTVFITVPDNEKNRPLAIKVLNELGQTVLNANTKSVTNSSVAISIEDLAPGAYFILLQTEQHNYTARFMKTAGK